MPLGVTDYLSMLCIRDEILHSHEANTVILAGHSLITNVSGVPLQLENAIDQSEYVGLTD